MEPATFDPTLDVVIGSGEQVIGEVSRHPAITSNPIKKDDEVKMDTSAVVDTSVDYGDELDRIELANKLVADIDDVVRRIYKVVKSKYSQRFPELNLVDPMKYIITVQLLGNKPDRIADPKIKERLSEILERKMHLLVSMSAATTQGIKIEREEMDKILKACAVAIHLGTLKAKLLSFVERNMTVIAPNLSIVLGAPIAAKLMGLAGGLMNLATMPSCNIPTLGSHRTSNIETEITVPTRVGHIFESDLIQQIPFDHTKDVRKRAVKWVANKCVLAARCDLNQSDPDGSAGKKFREKIEMLISKELEPPPKKASRPLPAPIDKSGKKRGGKRVRRMKERYAQTELRKAANRINFGDVGDDAYQADLGFDRSQLKAIQKLRGPQINEKTKIRLSKGLQKELAKGQQSDKDAEAKRAAATKPSITRTSEGLEIFVPQAKETFIAGPSGETSRYFSESSGSFAIQHETKMEECK